jgi:nitrite reductase/ring-hydroxylating ferredoxin subunit
VASLDEIPEDGGLRIVLGELELGLYRVDGELYALDNICPHAGFPLSEGLLDGACVICPAHMWEFDVRTGLPPMVTTGERLARYAVRVQDDSAWIDPEQPLGDE